MTLEKCDSQIVQRFGFIWLGQMSNARKGSERMPCRGTGICLRSQHPLQIHARCTVMKLASQVVSLEGRADGHAAEEPEAIKPERKVEIKAG
jgi:hypothetical protein